MTSPLEFRNLELTPVQTMETFPHHQFLSDYSTFQTKVEIWIVRKWSKGERAKRDKHLTFHIVVQVL